jgi:ribosome maturation factor RimP
MEKIDPTLCEEIRSELAYVNCELVDLEVLNIRGTTVVKVYTDKGGGVTLDEISTAAKKLRDRFDQSDLLGAEYRLEVSSPGERRSLRGKKDLGKFVGRRVMLYLDDGSKRVGSIADADSDWLRLSVEGQEAEPIGRETIEDMHLLRTCNQ